MTLAEAGRAYLLTFIRGERTWGEVEVPGIRVDFDHWSLSEALQAEVEPVRATLSDVVKGFQEHLGQPRELQRWAFVLLNVSNSIELDEAFETTEDGELLLGALWDAAFGRPISSLSRQILNKFSERQNRADVQTDEQRR